MAEEDSLDYQTLLQTFQTKSKKSKDGVVVDLDKHFEKQRKRKESDKMKKKEAENNLHRFQPVPGSNLIDSSKGKKEIGARYRMIGHGQRDIRDSNGEITAPSYSSGQKPKPLVLAIILYIIAQEQRKRKQLTSLPQVYHQDTTENQRIVSLMSAVLQRSFSPSLFIGTRSFLNSSFAYFRLGPTNCERKREILRMPRDGAQIALDYEFPSGMIPNISDITDQTIVLILHGVNTDTSFGYMKAIMKHCTNQGFVAIGMNARSYGNIPMKTCRFMNSAYTNDLRSTVKILSSRYTKSKLFLVGFSMGANTLVKFLGESSNRLPTNLVGAVSLANPFIIQHSKLKFPMSNLMTAGTRKHMKAHTETIRQMSDDTIQDAFKKATSFRQSSSLSDISKYTSPFMIRNSVEYPYENSIGYSSNEEYWREASSRNYVANVSIPLLIVFADDDVLTADSTISSFGACLSNPNIIIARTPCGGHMGWHTSNWNNPFGSYCFTSANDSNMNWSERTVTKFISAVLWKGNNELHESGGSWQKIVRDSKKNGTEMAKTISQKKMKSKL